MMEMIRFSLLVMFVTTLVACSRNDSGDQALATDSVEQSEPEPTAEVQEPVVEDVPVTEIEPGLTMRVLKEGSGDAAAAGQTASVHYTGWLHDPGAPNNRGAKFDSSVDRGVPFEFPLGAGRVIQGWDRGVVGMLPGESRELTIAPDLAYGDRAIGDLIPPGSTLLFEVELLGVSGEPQAQ